MANTPVTYNFNQVSVALGNHIVSGYGEGDVITIAPSGEGTTKRVGADGEVVRSISTDKTNTVTFTLLKGSQTSVYLNNQFEMDQRTGDGMFPILIKDNKGGTKFSSSHAWVSQKAEVTIGATAGDTAWTLHTAAADAHDLF